MTDDTMTLRSWPQGCRLALQVSELLPTCVDSPTYGAQDSSNHATQQSRSTHRGVGAFGFDDCPDSSSGDEADDPSDCRSKTRRGVGSIDNGLIRLHSQIYHRRSSNSEETGQASYD